MKLNVSLVAVAAMLGSLLLSGCNSPESVCKKLIELRASDAKEKPSDDDKKKANEECTKELTEEKNKDPKVFDCISDCAGKGSWKEYKECSKSCEKDAKK